MVPPDQLDIKKLKAASAKFLSDANYGAIDIEAVMQEVFGDFGTRSQCSEAQAWSDYWRELALYEESMRGGVVAQLPQVCAPLVL